MFCPIAKKDIVCSECRAYDKYLRRCILMSLALKVTEALEEKHE